MKLKLKVGKTLFAFLRRPGMHDAETHLSNAVDEALENPVSIEDRVLAALVRAAHPSSPPPGYADRSWRALEDELFGSPATRPLLSIPYRDRFGPGTMASALRRLPRLGAAMAVAGVALLCWGAMRAPYLYGSAVVHEVAQAWARLDNYRAAVQCISRVPGFQMEWTGQQYYRKPGHLRTDLEIAGGPVRLVTDGDLAAYDGPVSGPSPSICRFILRTVQLEALVSVLPALEGVKYEGSGEILGEKCQVISFPESASEASPAREGPPPGSASPGRGRAWISDRIHLPLQVEYYMSDGALAVSYRCVRLLPNVGVDDPGISLPPGSASARSFGRIVVVTEQRKFSVAE